MPEKSRIQSRKKSRKRVTEEPPQKRRGKHRGKRHQKRRRVFCRDRFSRAGGKETEILSRKSRARRGEGFFRPPFRFSLYPVSAPVASKNGKSPAGENPAGLFYGRNGCLRTSDGRCDQARVTLPERRQREQTYTVAGVPSTTALTRRMLGFQVLFVLRFECETL